MTTVIVTHNIEEAVFLGQRLLLLRQPPHRAPMVLENPEAGHPEYRDRPRFEALCAQVREMLGEAARAQA